MVPSTGKVMRFAFNVSLKRHQTVYTRVVEIDLTTSQLPSTSWVVDAVAMASKASKLKAESPANVLAYGRVICGIAGSLEWLRVARESVEMLNLNLLLRSFAAMDKYLEKESGRTSLLMRRLLQNYAKNRNIDKIFNLRKMYRSPHELKSSSRGLISDKVFNASKVPYPIGAIPFKDPEELRTQAIAKITETLTRIEAAALSELECLADRHSWYEETFTLIDVDSGLVDRVRVLCSSRGIQKRKFPRWFSNIPTPKLAAIYYLLCKKALAEQNTEKFQLFCPREKEVLQWVADQGRRVVGPQRLVDEFLGEEVIQLRYLHSCLVILQKHTGWNVNSVLEMNSTMIESSGKAGYIIQGYKSRTAKLTPYVEVLPSDFAPIRAIRHLIKRLGALKRLCWIDVEENRLWLNHRVIKDGKARSYVGWGPMLRDFCEKHGFPQFSAEQIRVEVLASYGLKRGGLEAARHVAGHSEYKTVSGYLDQLLLHRVNDAYALEFERRLEASVRFRMGQDTSVEAEEDLLYSVGGGLSCSDPLNPPDPRLLKNAICMGTHCNIGDGCRNRSLVITPTRMEEVIRTSNMYKNSWREMLELNAELFSKTHVPNMLVNDALFSILDRSAYRHVFNQIKAAVHNER